MVRSYRVSIVTLIVLALAYSQYASAQPLADRLPSDALLYVGWAGSEKLGPAYSQSHLKGVMNASNLPQLFSELFPKIARRLQLEPAWSSSTMERDAL